MEIKKRTHTKEHYKTTKPTPKNITRQRVRGAEPAKSSSNGNKKRTHTKEHYKTTSTRGGTGKVIKQWK
ncbi:hypothetical protein BX666DRAFT_1895874 [Dichotomocladium elegans]|nr:hypothetical protein BX666DRAFT_1895874 [Dichotomocladium elegans]